jgi:hypothetical protein
VWYAWRVQEATKLPRWSLAVLSATAAAILGWTAAVLPYRDWTFFAGITATVAIAHGATALAAAVGSPARGPLWRLQSAVALAYFAYVTWGVLWSATYVAALYGTLGRGIAAALAVCWAVVVLLTVPLSAWGIAATGGFGSRRRATIGSALWVLLTGLGVARAAAAPDARSLPTPAPSTLSSALSSWAHERSATAGSAPLLTSTAAQCDEPPGLDRATLVVTYPATAEEPQIRTRCLQASAPDSLLAELVRLLEGEDTRGPIKVDLIKAIQPLHAMSPVLDALMLRPGLDGVCHGNRCLMPWQLVVAEQFGAYAPVSAVPELRFGVAAAKLREQLDPDETPRMGSIEGLTRIETISVVVDAAGKVHGLSRLRATSGPVDAKTLDAGIESAQAYVLSAQGDDGRFRYKLDPFTGRVSYRGFSIARQAGTTLALCELADDNEPVSRAIHRSLDMLASTLSHCGDVSVAQSPTKRRAADVRLGPTALSTVIFVACRERIGRRYDEEIGRMARFLLSMQREDGGFFPRFRLADQRPIPGHDPLYAGGQAVLALTSLEGLSSTESIAELPSASELRVAVQRAMDYYSGPYWSYFAGSFFFLEENWHCLAARAALSHHRHDAYERFCLDYVAFKRRLILDGDSRVTDDFLGGYGFGNVIPPHNTSTAGFGEALAAAIAVKQARGQDVEPDRATMHLVLGFLLHHQWDAASCFACSREHRVVGALSEHMASPQIRIDYVQHAWAAMGHGGRALGLI